MKDSNLSQSACVCADEDKTTLPERMRTCKSAHGSSEQAIGDLLRCLVQKRIVCFVFALIHDLTCCSHFLLVGLF